jgi:hypothetical protein
VFETNTDSKAIAEIEALGLELQTFLEDLSAPERRLA